MRSLIVAGCLAVAGFSFGTTAHACGGQYVVQRGETLSEIADRLYDRASLWPVLYERNRAVMGSNPNTLEVGTTLTLDCIDGLPRLLSGSTAFAPAADSAETEQIVTRTEISPLAPLTRAAPAPANDAQNDGLRILAGQHLTPFVGQNLVAGGMLTEVLEAAVSSMLSADQYSVDWTAPAKSVRRDMFDAHAIEMAYPFAKPKCAGADIHADCIDFLYSRQLFEYLELLYVDQTRPIPFAEDNDLIGRRICRPQGMGNYMLDENGRNWVSENKITLTEPALPTDCFFQLLAGEVDGVILNEFTGREKLTLMGLNERIIPLRSQPVAITGAHVKIQRDHPNAALLLSTVNAGLVTIQADGRYNEIVARHLEQIWAQF